MNPPDETTQQMAAAGLPGSIDDRDVCRPSVHGKFLFVGNEKYWVKGVTYGTFRPEKDGRQFPDAGMVLRDFAAMAAIGVNTVRVYTPPPTWLLDIARDQGLRVMIGLPWEQHITFLDDKARVADIRARLRTAVAVFARHPAVLCYAIGNEIPSSIVRWYGRKRIAVLLHRLYEDVKAEDPEALVTYVNYPTTEYLQLPFLDLFCFNVYLESPEEFAEYLARLQNLAGERPLLMAEMGLDSQRNGKQAQATSLSRQVHDAFAGGCAGTFVFAWTDEWHRGGHDIEDWDFGLTTRAREPKPALQAVACAYRQVPFPADTNWPKISVVVCSYNGSATIRDTMEGLAQLDYPSYEVIVINDGSTDAVPDIVGEYDVRLISTENCGLSNARNAGWQAASGEIVAYIDDDAYPDPHWLQYVAHTFMTTDYIGVGGPNLAPPGDGLIADCIANAPGGPVHVLVGNTEAEHIPGCNMAFRRAALAAIDGFDPRYRTAGDDVDVCWRLQEQVGKIGFHAAAVDWHHRRNSLLTYWKQQQGYGKAESLLEDKWPDRYNASGHLSWRGQLYGKGLTELLPLARSRIYHGTWGTAMFQSIYEPAAGVLRSLPLMPEWFLVIGILLLLTVLGFSWAPLLYLWPLLALAVLAPVGQAIVSAAQAEFTTSSLSRGQRLGLYAITAGMHLAQPMARLMGRIRHGLTPWRKRHRAEFGLPRSRCQEFWSEQWQAPETWLAQIHTWISERRAPCQIGGDYHGWDLSVQGGLLGRARFVMAVEEHGAGKQMLRFRTWPSLPATALAAMVMLALIAALAGSDGAWLASAATGAALVWLMLRATREYSGAAAILDASIASLGKTDTGESVPASTSGWVERK